MNLHLWSLFYTNFKSSFSYRTKFQLEEFLWDRYTSFFNEDLSYFAVAALSKIPKMIIESHFSN